jgi:2-polyprenyl-3-methyl-5-hydroxy-6-metoxy-1,4-benzoquinol methylase
MNPNKICFIYCVNDEELLQESLKYLGHLDVPEGFEIDTMTVTEATSMTEGYSYGMKKSDAKYKVYLHQDVLILNKSFISEVITLFQKYPRLGMLGMIGTGSQTVNGVWWESNHKFGMVYESHTGKMELLSFQEVTADYERVMGLDGLIMITQHDVPWRTELFKGWHFYDMSQCIEFIKAGYDVGVPRQNKPWCIHDCGIVNVKNGYEENRQIFLKEYSEVILPISEINESEIHGVYQEDYAIKHKQYYQGLNQYLLNLIDHNAKFILEVGCAEGKLGSAIKEKTGAFVAGIEYYAPAAKEAESKLDNVIIGDIENLELPYVKESFDYIIFGDVLDHLKDPLGVLKKVRPYLDKSGSILTCIPNVGHISILESLLAGQWTYTNSGLLDKTHFRFFTLNEISRMFRDAGYRIEHIESITITNERYEKMIVSLEHLRKSFEINNQQFQAEAGSYQYVIKASKLDF